VYVAIGLSGLGALGAEVVWTRLLSLMIGGTVYTFSIILAAFLAGLGIGSSIGALLARAVSPRLALAACQLLLAAGIGWAAYQVSASMPYWPIDPALSLSPWHNFQLDVLRCLWALLPAASLWGASFPLALAAVSEPGQDPGRLVGGVYAANTIGAITGALGFSVFVIVWIGTQRAQQVLIGIAALSAVTAILPTLVRLPRSATPRSAAWFAGVWLARGAVLAGAIAAAGWFAWNVPPTSGELIAHGRYLPSSVGRREILYQGEGMNSSVAVSLADGERSFHVSGKVEASSLPQDMRLQRMLGNVPALVHPQPKSVLVVGCGAGVTAGSFVVHPSIERVVICEIEPLIPKVVAEHFVLENYGVVRDKRVEIVYDDARHYILTAAESFDIITSDPIHPWVKGAATLYTREYFELCKKRLKPGGIVSQWVPLYESNLAAVKSELATFFDVFPDGTVWGNDENGQGYDVVLLGSAEPLTINVDQLTRRLDREDHQFVAESLYQVGFDSAIDFLGTYAGCARELRPWLADAETNRDHNLRLQYLAGMGSGRYEERSIYKAMLSYRRYPQQLFLASTVTTRELRDRLGLSEHEP
jgi:spermidine synthase